MLATAPIPCPPTKSDTMPEARIGRLSKGILIVSIGAIICGLSMSSTWFAHQVGLGKLRQFGTSLDDDELSFTLGFSCLVWALTTLWILKAHRQIQFPWIAFSLSGVMTLAVSFFTPYLLQHDMLLLAALLTTGGTTLLLWLPAISKLATGTVENHIQNLEPKCPACGYCMKGLHQARCPECGEAHVIEELFISTPIAR